MRRWWFWRFVLWVRPGVALALSWSMIAVEAVLQASNSYLLSNSSAFNFFIAAVAGVGAMRAILYGQAKGDWPSQGRGRLSTADDVLLYLAGLVQTTIGRQWLKSNCRSPYIVVFGFVAPLCAVNER